MVIHIHGLQGQDSTKAARLRKMGLSVISPIYNRPEEYVKVLDKTMALCKMTRPADLIDPVRVVVGISLGAPIALLTALECDVHAVLVNPCLDLNLPRISASWRQHVQPVLDRIKFNPDISLTVMANDDDKILGHRWNELNEWCPMIFFPKGGHRATNWDTDIAPKIKAIHEGLVRSVKMQRAST